GGEIQAGRTTPRNRRLEGRFWYETTPGTLPTWVAQPFNWNSNRVAKAIRPKPLLSPDCNPGQTHQRIACSLVTEGSIRYFSVLASMVGVGSAGKGSESTTI